MILTATSSMHHSVEHFTPETIRIEGEDRRDIILKAIHTFLNWYEGAWVWSLDAVKQAFKDIHGPINEVGIKTDGDVVIRSCTNDHPDDASQVIAWWRVNNEGEENIGFGPTQDGVRLNSRHENHWIHLEELNKSADWKRLMKKSKAQLVQMILDGQIVR